MRRSGERSLNATAQRVPALAGARWPRPRDLDALSHGHTCPVEARHPHASEPRRDAGCRLRPGKRRRIDDRRLHIPIRRKCDLHVRHAYRVTCPVARVGADASESLCRCSPRKASFLGEPPRRRNELIGGVHRGRVVGGRRHLGRRSRIRKSELVRDGPRPGHAEGGPDTRGQEHQQRSDRPVPGARGSLRRRGHLPVGGEAHAKRIARRSARRRSRAASVDGGEEVERGPCEVGGGVIAVPPPGPRRSRRARRAPPS